MSTIAATVLTIAAFVYLSEAVGVYRAYRRDFRDDPWWSCAVVAVLWPVALAVQLLPKKLFVLPLAAALLSGCVNVYERWPTSAPQVVDIYQATRAAAGLAVVGSFPQMMSDSPSDSGSLRWENCLTVPFIGLPCAVDALCEAVLDTALLPCDLILSNQRNKKGNEQ